jgi:hypothetical protein
MATMATKTLQSRHLFTMDATIAPEQDLGTRKIYNITGGTITGERLNGTVLPGGGDWVTFRADGSAVLDVRGTLQTDDGELIFVWYRGVVAPSANGLYWRTTPVFETASEKYQWLNNIVAVGVHSGDVQEGRVAYDVYEIL